MVDDESFASRTKSTSRAHNRLAYVNNRIFSPFSSDHYCIYGLLPRHADDVGKCVSEKFENENFVLMFFPSSFFQSSFSLNSFFFLSCI